MASRNQRREALEKTIQAKIEIAIGSEPDLLILRNSVGRAVHFKEDGSEYHVPYGLGVSSPDLVGILRTRVAGRGLGLWFCLEIKVPGEDATDAQEKCHKIWRGFGAFVETVHSVEEARDALARARRGLP